MLYVLSKRPLLSYLGLNAKNYSETNLVLNIESDFFTPPKQKIIFTMALQVFIFANIFQSAYHIV